MCGIAGGFAYRDSVVDLAGLRRMCDHMASRGPDGAGTWVGEGGRVALGHRRLAIIDLSETGAQPMTSADGRLVVTFNGEIYNYRELRAELLAKGYPLRSSSDTEVLLYLYEDRGEAMVEVLRGMFAFAIWDARSRTLLLARDPYGIKPLYFAHHDGSLRFASQVRTLMASGGIAREPDPAGWVGFYLFGSVPEPFTSYRDIRAVPAGGIVRVEVSGRVTERTYFTISGAFARAEEQGSRLDSAGLDAAARRALRDSVAHHLVADVPVGVFLSAGIDSGALLGLMREATSARIQAVTLSFEEFGGAVNDEGPLAAMVADRYGASHTRRIVTEREFGEDLPLILAAMDQPTVDGINTWFISKAARELGLKGAISGLGGDELFGGYSTFRTVPAAVRMIGWRRAMSPSGLKRALEARAGTGPLARLLGPKAAALATLGSSLPGAYLVRRGVFMPGELASVLDADLVREGLERLSPLSHIEERLGADLRTDFARVAALEASLYMRNQLLRDTDWASMAHSLEVRVPLVDKVLLETLAPPLVGRRTPDKLPLARSPQVPLPEAITSRGKTGFSTPIATWLRNDARTQAWQKVKMLAAPNCRWARRWAFAVAEQAGVGVAA